MFLAGANQKQAELRTQSIKGALRFWWRAIYGGDDIADMKQREAEIFGDAGDIGKSKVLLKLVKKKNYNSSNYSPVPHKTANFTFVGLDPKQSFILELSADSIIHSLFELFAILGGLGRRSRRGFGSFIIKKINQEDYTDIINLDFLQTLINKIHQNDFQQVNSSIENNRHSNINFPFIKAIQFGKGIENASLLLNKIGQSSHTNNSQYTGFVQPNRQASPIYVSITKKDNIYIPIITTLNGAYRNNSIYGVDKSLQFINDILDGDTI